MERRGVRLEMGRWKWEGEGDGRWGGGGGGEGQHSTDVQQLLYTLSHYSPTIYQHW